MKKILYTFILLTFYSCKKENVNVEVEHQFKTCIKTINDYNIYKGEINDSLLANFYFSTEYLSDLTKINANYICADIPEYKSREDCLNDISKWEKWFIKNKNQITKEYSDSIVNQVLKKKIWWNNDFKK